MKQHIVVAAILFVVGAASLYGQTDLSLTFAGSANGGSGGDVPIAPAGQALYGLLVTNDGPATATGVNVTITFPPKTSIDDPSRLSFFGCSASVVAGSPTVICSHADLASGAAFADAILIDLASDYPWQNGLGPTAIVTSSSPDPVPSNNSVTDHLVVQASAAIPVLDARLLVVLIAVLAVIGIVSRQ